MSHQKYFLRKRKETLSEIFVTYAKKTWEMYFLLELTWSPLSFQLILQVCFIAIHYQQFIKLTQAIKIINMRDLQDLLQSGAPVLPDHVNLF